MRGCSQGGVHGCSWGGHVWLLWGGVWLLWGACMVAPGGACMVAPGGGHVWDTTRYGDTVNERVVRILLECILVVNILTEYKSDELPFERTFCANGN